MICSQSLFSIPITYLKNNNDSKQILFFSLPTNTPIDRIRFQNKTLFYQEWNKWNQMENENKIYSCIRRIIFYLLFISFSFCNYHIYCYYVLLFYFMLPEKKQQWLDFVVIFLIFCGWRMQKKVVFGLRYQNMMICAHLDMC